MTGSPVPRPGILDIAPYVGGDATADAPRLIRLASNESALGASPRAADAYRAAGAGLERYPDGHCRVLREALAQRYGVDPARVVCGAGSDELIALLARSYAGEGDEVLHSAHGFLMYAIAARSAGATPVAAPERGLRTDVEALLARVTPRTRLVFLANPNNPTGSFLAVDELERLHSALPDDVLLVIDAAYADYIVRNDYTAGIDLVERHGNVAMLRTFSKIYGLAALRLGWGYFPTAVAEVLNRVRGPFNVSVPAQAAGVAALEDVAFVDAGRAYNEVWRPWTAEQLAALGLTVHPSVANFLLVEFPARAAAATPETDAAAARGFLKQRGILVRQMEAYGLPQCLRIAIGTGEEMRATVSAIADYLG